MKLLFDANLSPKLVERLASLYPNSAHVLDFALPTDRSIWDFAAAEGFVIVSKDADFQSLSTIFGAPPKVVWLRVGNAGTARITTILSDRRAKVQALVDDPEAALLILA